MKNGLPSHSPEWEQEIPKRLTHRDWLRTLRGSWPGEQWEQHVLSAPGLPLLMQGIEREGWLAALHSTATSYSQAVAAMLPDQPVADDYRRVIAATDELRDALQKFGSGPNARAPDVFGLSFLLAGLRDWAEDALEERRAGGRPANGLAKEAVHDLLLLYWHGFGRKPSRSPTGPASRFIAAFFDGIRGAEVELIDDWRPEDGEDLPPRRKLPCPPARAIPDMVRHALPGLLSTPLPPWWEKFHLKRPRFSD